MNRDALTTQYHTERRNALKRTAKQIRQDAGLTPETIAEFLGCTKERVTSAEDVDNQTEYSVTELELLAMFCGKYPTDIVRTSQDDALHLAMIMTEKQTRSALLDLVDCVLPSAIAQLYSDPYFSPGDIIFSPDGERIASIVDTTLEDDWWDNPEGPRPTLTVVCWNTRTGKVTRQRRFQHLEHITFLDKERIVLATARPLQDIPDSYDFEGEYQVQIWNLRTNSVEHTIDLLDRVGNLAGSREGTFLAAFFPKTTTIQCWRIAGWQPYRAYELEPPADSDLEALGFTYRTETRVDMLPRTRKFTLGGNPYQAHRFEWTGEHMLLFSTSKRITELDVRSQHGWSPTHSSIEHPIVPWTYMVNSRDETREIAVTEISYRYEIGESDVELWYLTPRRNRSPLDTYVQITKRYAGSVYSPRIIDDAMILALVDYQTPYPWDKRYLYRTRTAVCNLLSGRIALLDDTDRLEESDTVQAAYLSPQANAIAYWICPFEGTPRLSIQYITLAPLRTDGVSLPEALEQSRQQRLQEHTNTPSGDRI